MKLLFPTVNAEKTEKQEKGIGAQNTDVTCWCLDKEYSSDQLIAEAATKQHEQKRQRDEVE